MQATLTWLDLTASDRDKMRRVLDLFKEQGTLDEMGLGSLRDVLSDAAARSCGLAACQPRSWRANGFMQADVFPDPTAPKIATPVYSPRSGIKRPRRELGEGPRRELRSRAAAPPTRPSKL